MAHRRCRNRRWAATNPEKVRAIKRRWDKRNPDRAQRQDPALARARRKRWADANKAAVREKNRRWEARVRGALAAQKIPAAAIAERVAMWGGNCWICGEPADCVDHVKPVAKGGAHLLCNLRPACGDCNQRKSARWPFPSSSRGALAAIIESKRLAGSKPG